MSAKVKTARARTHRIVLLALAAIGVAFSGCASIPRAPQPVTPEERPAHNLQVYDEAWKRVQHDYYDGTFHGLDWASAGERHRAEAETAPDDTHLYRAINAMLGELKDGHTHASSPQSVVARRLKSRVLVGLVLRAEPEAGDGRVLVLATTPGSSAAEAGVLPGWVLVSCDGKKPDTVLGAGKLVEGQTVNCEFLDHHGMPHTLALVGRKLSTEPIHEERILDDGFVYLRFDIFDTPAARWLRDELHKHRDAPGVIVDLRANPGGDAFVLMRALGEFFPSPVRVGTFVARRGFRFPVYTWWWFCAAHTRVPTAVLVSGASASSSEIFASTMQFHHRAVIVGTKTSGIVRGSRFGPLPDGGRLQMSMQDYLTPDGRHLEGEGVTPDIAVEQTLDDLRSGRDPVIDAAVGALRAQPSPWRGGKS